MKKDLLSCQDIDRKDMETIFDLAAKLKAGRGKPNQPRPLEGKSVATIFAKSSTRTRVSFDVGIYELGGHTLYLDQSKTQMGRGETVPDTAHVLERYLAGIVIRTFAQKDVEELAANAKIPVINALTDDFHPCQALTDVFTMLEHAGKTDGLKLAYLGDGASNMANSLTLAASKASCSSYRHQGSDAGCGFRLYRCLGQHGFRGRIQETDVDPGTVPAGYEYAASGEARGESAPLSPGAPRR